MSSKDYWVKREAEQLKHNITEEKEFDKQLKQIYSNMLDNIQTEIDAFYGRYAKKEGISLAEARKRVTEADINAYERKARRYVADAAKDRRANGGKTDRTGYYFSEQANEEMRLYNLTMKVNRLEMLKANIGLELIDGHTKLERFMYGILRGRTEAELERQAGILGKTIQDNAKMANTIVNASFHNAKYSDRIWMHQDLLKAEISKLLKTGLIQGKNPRVLARELQKKFDVSQYSAERLMRTELARVQTDAQKKSFEKNGFEEFTFIVNGGCCPICQGLSGKHFKVSKMMPGENAPPMHPNCRCSVAAYEDSGEYEAWLDYLDKGGTTEEWNRLGRMRAIYGYMSAQSYVINEKLRKENELTDEDEKFVGELDKALKDMPRYEGNLQRALIFYSDDDISLFMKDYEIGKKVTYNEYLSTTKSGNYNPEGQVQIFIQGARMGRDISEINKSESEVLYERNSSFVVLNIVEHEGKYYILLGEDDE